MILSAFTALQKLQGHAASYLLHQSGNDGKFIMVHLFTLFLNRS